MVLSNVILILSLFHYRSLGCPIRIKKKVAELQNECLRQEEVSILEEEMKNYLVFYKNTVIPQLKEDETELLTQLGEDQLFTYGNFVVGSFLVHCSPTELWC